MYQECLRLRDYGGCSNEGECSTSVYNVKKVDIGWWVGAETAEVLKPSAYIRSYSTSISPIAVNVRTFGGSLKPCHPMRQDK